MGRLAIAASVCALLGVTDAYFLPARVGASRISMMADRKSPDLCDWSDVPADEFVQLKPSWG